MLKRKFWYIRAVLATSALLGVSGCEDPAAPGSSIPDEVHFAGLRFSARTEVTEPDRVETTVTATNPGAVPVETVILGGGCRTRLRAFEDFPTPSSSPVWDQDRLHPNCADIGFRISLEPGAWMTFSGGGPIDAILGDSLPEAAYHFTVRLRQGPVDYEMLSGEAFLRRP